MNDDAISRSEAISNLMLQPKLTRSVVRRVLMQTNSVNTKFGVWEEADDGDGVVCSVCREDFCTIIHETERFKYCPNCGVKME